LSHLLDRLREAQRLRPDEVFCHFYQDAQACRTVLVGELESLLARRVPHLKAKAMVLILVSDPLEQVLWWVAAVFGGATPGILTPLTRKIHKSKYFDDLTASLSAYGDAMVVVDEQHHALLLHAELRAQTVLVAEALAADGQSWTAPELAPEHPLLFQQSSGTTGLRKGMLLSHQAVCNQLSAYSASIALWPTDVIVSWLPLYHDMGLIACMALALYARVPLVLTSCKRPSCLFHNSGLDLLGDGGQMLVGQVQVDSARTLAEGADPASRGPP